MNFYKQRCFLLIACLAALNQGIANDTKTDRDHDAGIIPVRPVPGADSSRPPPDTNQIMQAAKSGDPYYQGVCYYKGIGVAANKAEAARWFRLAAEQGLAQAQCYMGMCYDNGDGVKQDHTEAARWFRLAAEQGETYACYRLGILYFHGKGVPKNRAESMRLVKLAAEQGHVDAQMRLGFAYKYGLYVPKNQAASQRWLKLAAQAGHPDAYVMLIEKAIRSGDFLEAGKLLEKAQAIAPNSFRLKWLALPLTLVQDGKTSARKISASTPMALIFSGILLAFGLVMVGIMFWKARTGIIMAAAWLIFFLIAQIMVALILVSAPATSAFSGSTLFSIIMAAGTLPVIAGSLGKQRAQLWQWPVPASGSRTKLLACIMLCGFLMAKAIGLLEEYGLRLIGLTLPKQPTLPFITKLLETAPLTGILFVVILLPIAEEIIFRGWLDNALRHYLRPWFSILVSALLFALVHGQLDFVLSIFLMGIILGWTKKKTGTLWAPILLHMLNNGYACYVMALKLQ